MPIDPDDPSAAPWEQVAAILRARIASGEYQPGTRLPSVMAFEEEFELNPKTIRKALDALKRDGLLVSAQGRGTFVKPPAPDSEEPADS